MDEIGYGSCFTKVGWGRHAGVIRIILCPLVNLVQQLSCKSVPVLSKRRVDIRHCFKCFHSQFVYEHMIEVLRDTRNILIFITCVESFVKTYIFKINFRGGMSCRDCSCNIRLN